eukprot:Clim_evm10s161 gene=Clim_evmTU10s161
MPPDVPRPVQNPKLLRFLNSIIHSKSYFIFQFFLLAACVGSILWTLLEPRPNSPGFIVLELTINILLITEVGIRMAAMGPKEYWKYPGNKLDVCVCIFSLATFLLYAIEAGKHKTLGEEVDEVGGLIALIFRTLVNVLRITALVRQQRDRVLNTKLANISFLHVDGSTYNPDADDQNIELVLDNAAADHQDVDVLLEYDDENDAGAL